MPWSEISSRGLAKAVVGPEVGLFVDPGIYAIGAQVEKYQGMDAVVFHPEQIRVLNPFIQERRGVGKVDPATGFPLAVSDRELWKQVNESRDVRVLYRDRDMTIACVVVGVFNRHGYVYPMHDLAFSYGVASVDLSQPTPAEDLTHLRVEHRRAVTLVTGSGEVPRPEGLVLTGTQLKVQAAFELLSRVGVQLVQEGPWALFLPGIKPESIMLGLPVLASDIRAPLARAALI